MSLRGLIGLEKPKKIETSPISEDIARRELAHVALFKEVTELRDVCKFLLDGHKNHIIYVDDKPVFNITCIGGTTTRIKITEGSVIDDYSVSDAIISRKTTTYADDSLHADMATFDVTSAYMNGYTELEMTEQLRALYTLQEDMLVADGCIQRLAESDSQHHAA